MPTPSYTITCTKKELMAPGVYELRFSRPEGFNFKAGQFVLFDVPLVGNPLDIQPRAYSIASKPSEKDLIFVIKMKTGGRFSEWLEQVLDVGSEVTIKGPFGFFTVKDNTNDLFFTATGAGMAPFRGQVLDLLEKKDARRIHLLFGARTESDFFWLELFRLLEKEHPNFTLHLCLSGPSDTWTGHKGRVQTRLTEIVEDSAKSDIYICGAPEMVKDVKTMALESLKLPKSAVHAEGYI